MPSKSSKRIDKLATDALRASRLNETMATRGWEVVMEIIQTKYNFLMNDLLEKENAEARGGINTITEIMNDISREIKFGEVAQEKYRKQVMDAGL